LITFPNELRESTGFAQSANARLSPRLSAFSRAREAKADATASVKRLNNEYRYHLLTKAASRKPLNELLQRAQGFAREQKWSATALVIDVDPFTLL